MASFSYNEMLTVVLKTLTLTERIYNNHSALPPVTWTRVELQTLQIADDNFVATMPAGQ